MSLVSLLFHKNYIDYIGRRGGPDWAHTSCVQGLLLTVLRDQSWWCWGSGTCNARDGTRVDCVESKHPNSARMISMALHMNFKIIFSLSTNHDGFTA